LRDGIAPSELARCIELAAHGFDLEKADASQFVDLERSIRLLIAGALSPASSAAGRQSARSQS
jgi:hypothetical protein